MTLIFVGDIRNCRLHLNQNIVAIHRGYVLVEFTHVKLWVMHCYHTPLQSWDSKLSNGIWNLSRTLMVPNLKNLAVGPCTIKKMDARNVYVSECYGKCCPLDHKVHGKKSSVPKLEFCNAFSICFIATMKLCGHRLKPFKLQT